MILKLLEIKKLGIFNDYQWNPNLPPFERFNIIYGWNGSGKTTLSQLFSAIDQKEMSEFPDLKYKIETDNGEYIQGTAYSRKIRVFNQKYISQNVDIFSGKANPIYILGEENKKLVDLIREDETMLNGKIKELETKKGNLASKENEKGNLFTSTARNIGIHVLGALARNYRKNNAESDFALLNSKQLLSPEEVEKLLATLLQQESPTLTPIVTGNIESDLKEVFAEATTLLKKTVELKAISRLQENPEIALWVEKGFELHQQQKSKKCEFCGQPLPKEQINALAKHFNAADKALKIEADVLLAKLAILEKTVQSIEAVDKANLYSEFQEEYKIVVGRFEAAQKALLTDVLYIKDQVNNKKLHTTDEIALDGNLRVDSFMREAILVNDLISKHNKKSTNFSTEKIASREKLKNHHLSQIFDDVKTLNIAIAKLNNEISILENGHPEDIDNIGIKKLLFRIKENKNKISESGRACDELNKQLGIFLGRNELVFERTDDGYLLKRNGKIAKNLSEGEKTAIAFVYFTVHLKDRDFKIRDDIVVIDDPISSLDSNSLFQAFSFLKNTVQDSYQVFIFTHNFDFLQLVINWFHNSPGRKAYYMINNLGSDDIRTATLTGLDKLLRNYPTEYQYLFKLLYKFTPDGTIESVYHLPNVARKVLDNFLMVMYPDNRSSYKKLEQINFDEKEKTAIYKFTNDQSHITGKAFNPALVSEARNVIKSLLAMMCKVFPDHYKALEDAVKNSDAS